MAIRGSIVAVLTAIVAVAPSIAAMPRGAQVAGVQAGEAVYSRCLACHALAYDRTGPRHCGLFGRRAGSVKGFAYSNAIPGTAMGYAGVKDDKERADLIAFLKQANNSPECRK